MNHSENSARMLAITRGYNEEILSVTKNTQIQHVSTLSTPAVLALCSLEYGSVRAYRRASSLKPVSAEWDQKLPPFFLDFPCRGRYF